MTSDAARICVFCGSAEGARPIYRAAAEELADEMVARGHGLVYGGGQVGLMGAIATRVSERGGEVVGIIPRTLTDREIAFEGATQLHVVESMHERKALMNELSSAFIALPGGYGTLEELFEVVTWAQIGIHGKPFGLLDVDGFYAPLLSFLDNAEKEGFIRPEYRRMLAADDRPADLLDRLRSWSAPAPIAWLDLDET
jgi:uncharacterized protein (TIGR00730 family)